LSNCPFKFLYPKTLRHRAQKSLRGRNHSFLWI